MERHVRRTYLLYLIALVTGLVLLITSAPAFPVTPDTRSPADRATAITNPSWYFAEGYTGENFQEYLCLANISANETDVDVTYLFEDETPMQETYTVAGLSRFTINVNQVVGPGREVSMHLTGFPGETIVAERPMYFNYEGKWTGGHTVLGAESPAYRWYFAEGTTREGFEEWITVLNPGPDPANLEFHYMVEGKGESVMTSPVEGESRATFRVTDHIQPGEDLSLMLDSSEPVVAERPMYFSYAGLTGHNWTGGHDVMGAEQPTRYWFFAEGTTRTGFEEWLCIQNPEAIDIDVEAQYLLGPGQGGPIRETYNIPAYERLTVSVNQVVGPGKDVSVELYSPEPFVAERPMYFAYNGTWDGGHDVIGAMWPQSLWYFAEGFTGTNFQEYLCIQNPFENDATVTVTFFRTDDAPLSTTFMVPADSRYTMDVNSEIGPDKAVSTMVSSDRQIVVERPMYFNFNGMWPGGHDVMGWPCPT